MDDNRKRQHNLTNSPERNTLFGQNRLPMADVTDSLSSRVVDYLPLTLENGLFEDVLNQLNHREQKLNKKKDEAKCCCNR
jgi:hypothetical protein